MKYALRALTLGERSGFAFPVVVVFSSLVLLVACSSSPPPLTGNALTYQRAKDRLKKGNFDEALDYAEGLISASSPNEFTERAQVLRAVLLGGQMSGYQNLTEAYQKGSDKTQNAHLKGEYRRLRNDNLQYWARRALGFGEVAIQLLKDGTIPSQLTLDAPYPSVEGPAVVNELNRVMDGSSIQPEDEEAASLDALRKGIDDTLADLIGGDRSKARSQLAAGPVKINGVDFALFLTRQLLTGASAFDHKHMHEPSKFVALHEQAEKAVGAAQAVLKESPNADQEKEMKKLQDELKATSKEQ